MTPEERNKFEADVKVCQDFALKHKVIFEDEGECGFGRECVGFMRGMGWIDYNPYEYFGDVKDQDLRLVELLSNAKHYEIRPRDAYHKHDCFAVLGRGPEAIAQLADWVRKLEALGCKLVKYETGAKGVQAVISGRTHWAVKI